MRTSVSALPSHLTPPSVTGDFRKRYFGTPLQTALTVVFAIFAIWIGLIAIRWGVLNATFIADERAGCAAEGACWAFIVKRLDQFLFGFYPEGERWRPLIVLLLPVALFIFAITGRVKRRQLIVGLAVVLTPVISLALLSGGFFGLTRVSTDKWGGLTLTVVIAMTSFIGSMPLAVLLALARRSEMPVVRMLATGFIELWRGLPLVAILFMAVILLPLILPPGYSVGRVETATIALTIYSAAYLAEVVRGGLQAIPLGQTRAASALGFGYWRTQGYVTLPQALNIALPGVVNCAIALLKDTSYVMIVGLFDFINIVTAALSDPKWLGSPTEAYIFVAAVYWLMCFGLSRWGRSIETSGETSREIAGR